MNLDPQQKRVVETSSHNALVLAGAGSGKTRVLTERIAWLIERQKVSPYEVMAITFTRKAAGELRERVEERVGSRAWKITMGTIHAVALRFLKRFGEIVGLRGRHLTVYSEWEADYLLREVAIDLGIYNGKAWKIPKKDVDRVFDLYYQEGKIPEETHPAYTLFQDFNARCRENNAVTYGNLLVAFRNLLVPIRGYLNFKHILIDEVQDIDPLQWEIINTIKTLCRASVFAVGDIDQSIFEWRGACPGYLVEHEAEFDIHRLESNYRSVPEIVKRANNLIGHNQTRISRTMEARRSAEPGSLGILPGIDSAEMARWISGYLATSWYNFHEFGVLARNHFLLDKLADELDTMGIPVARIGKIAALTNSPEFRKFHAFLKLLVNPFDNFSFLLIRDLIGLSRQEYREIRLQATRAGMSDFQAWMEGEWGGQVVKDHFFDTGLIEYLYAAAFTIKDMATESLPYGGLGWGFDVEECFRFVIGWVVDNPSGTIQGYLDWLATYDIQDEIREKDEDDDKVKIMTIHAAKGLEWPVVIVAGCNEGILPSKQAIDAGEIEQERRLMYVAMTRARDELILAVRPEVKQGPGGRVYTSPRSRFVGEM